MARRRIGSSRGRSIGSMCVGGLGKACKLPWIRKAAKRRIALNRRGALMPEVMFVGNRIRGRSLLRNLFTIRSGERLAARFRLAARPFAVLYDTAGNLVTAVTGEKQHGKKGMRFRYVSQLYDGAGRQVDFAAKPGHVVEGSVRTFPGNDRPARSHICPIGLGDIKNERLLTSISWSNML